MNDFKKQQEEVTTDPFVGWMDQNRRWINPLVGVLVIFLLRGWLRPLVLAGLMALNSFYFYRKRLRFEMLLFLILTILGLMITGYSLYIA